MHNFAPKLERTSTEVSFADIIRFFILHKKFICLTTPLLSILAIGLCLQIPRVYQKQITLAVKLNFSPSLYSSPPSRISQAGIVQSFVFSNPHQVHAFTFNALQQLKLAQTTVEPVFTNDPQTIDVVLKSASAQALNSASSQVPSQLLTKLQVPVQEILATNIQATETDIQKSQQILAQLKNEIAQLGQGSAARQTALEIELSRQVSNLAALEFDKKYLQQREQQLPDFTAKLISIKVVTASDIKLTRSPLQLMAIAIAISFLVAVLAAMIYPQLLPNKAVSPPQPEASKDV